MAGEAAPAVGCLRCGRRQTDPARGPSRWRRGVAGGRLVLVCPQCQAAPDWAAVLDRCAGCGSTALVRRLGDTVCRACGHQGPGLPGEAAPSTEGPSASAALAADVDEALRRVFGPGDGR